MLLDQACNYFGWPSARVVLHPSGKGAAVCVESADRRIGGPLKRRFPGLSVEVGILSSTPDSAATVWPQAIVCQFRSGASTEAIQEAHRLAWNFSGSAVLIALEPHRLTAWSCYQDPGQPEESRQICELLGNVAPSADSGDVQHHVRQMLHWVSLITGEIIRRNPKSFPMDGRADRLLLKNLRHVRHQLMGSGLPADFCHDLLARVIFTQFLFHRTDSAGNPFFSKSLMGRLASEQILRKPYSDLASILNDKDETYSLFRWLDGRFNGDLFPGKENQPETEHEAAWQAEKDAVSEQHLRYLAELISGTIDTTDRQLRLWPQYSFDTIPLEFISSVYEEFLNEERDANKAYYTPPHLVDYVLDAVLPWDGKDWDLHILDPACGSGIFLVKAFQRLIYRWRRQHDRDPRVRDLKPLLENNLFGIDINPNAVRVACFSLYLAMADAIDPRHYVTRERIFPRLRGKRLIRGDFFDDAIAGIRTEDDKETFDLVVGNAPWGDSSIKTTSEVDPIEPAISSPKRKKALLSTKGQSWAIRNSWPVTNHDIGPLFVAKGLKLINEVGRVAMLQPAPPWLYQRASPALELRRRFFTEFTVDEITNLSAVRRELFHDVIGPACVIVAGRGKPTPDSELYYFTPKPLRVSSESTELQIDPQDVSRVTHATAAADPLVWSVLALGGQRDLDLIRRLSRLPSLAKLKSEGVVQTRVGVIPGDLQKPLPHLDGLPYLDDKQFPVSTFLTLDSSRVPAWSDPHVDGKGSTDFEAFKNPQLLIKQSFSTKQGRFRAVLVNSSDPTWGVICKKTYLSVRDRDPDARHIASACLAYNSLVGTYFLFLISGRIGHYITEVLTEELMLVPLPDSVTDIEKIKSWQEIDQLVRSTYRLTQADWTLVDDFLEVSLPDAIRQAPGRARAKTTRTVSGQPEEPELTAFGQTMIRVLKSTFGRDKSITLTIYQEQDLLRLPVRMVTLYLDWPDREPLTIEPISADGLYEMLGEFHHDVLSKKVRSATGEGIGFQRVVFFVGSHQIGNARVSHVTIIKPDEYRYWTRSQAMRDADELAASILKAAQGKRAKR